MRPFRILGLALGMGLITLLTSCTGLRTNNPQNGDGIPNNKKDDPKANTLPIANKNREIVERIDLEYLYNGYGEAGWINVYNDGSRERVIPIDGPDPISEGNDLSDLELISNESAMPLEVSANVVGKTKYLVSGFEIIDSPVLQGDVTVSSPKVPGLSGNIWGCYDPQTRRFEEIDGSVAYDFGITDNLGAVAIASHYDFDAGTLDLPDAQELSLEVYTNNLPVDVSGKTRKIFGEQSGHGFQHALKVGKSFDLVDRLSLSVDAKGIYNDHYFTDAEGFAVAEGSANLNYDLGNGLNASLGYLHQTPLDKATFGDTFQKNGAVALGIGGTF
jgi:hypothetical protein